MYMETFTCMLLCTHCAHAHRQTQIQKSSEKTWTTKASMWAMNLLCFETKAQLKQRQDQREKEGEGEKEMREREQSWGLNTACLT